MTAARRQKEKIVRLLTESGKELDFNARTYDDYDEKVRKASRFLLNTKGNLCILVPHNLCTIYY